MNPALIALLILISILGLFAAYMRSKRKLKEIQRMFRQYNESQDPAFIVAWIEKKDTSDRLTRVLDYLEQIEEDSLAVQIVEAFAPDQFKGRHVRVFACRAFTYGGKRDQAVALAEDLLRDFPADDAILERYVETYLAFDETAKVKDMLEARLRHKYKGTAFKRQYAQVLAAENRLEEAAELLEEAVRKDRILYENTFFTPQKRLIYDQYLSAHTQLEKVRARMEKAET